MFKSKEVLQDLRKSILQADSVADWARKNGVSPQYVHDVLQKRREPGSKILTALGYAAVKVYERIEK